MKEGQGEPPNHHCLAAGKSSLVYVIDERSVLKEYYDDGIDVEYRALQRLGTHKNIVQLLGKSGNGLILQRGQPLVDVIRSHGTDNVSVHEKQKVKLLQQAAEGLRYIHNQGILHADVGCQNMIVVEDCLKFIDFEGCSIDGEEATSCYQWYGYRPSTPAITKQTDIFAYGCMIYEVMTGKPPFHEHAESEDRMSVVQRLYAENQFPRTQELPLGSIVQSCWSGSFHFMDEIIQAFQNI